ncbi:hypothetical protein SAMN05192566_0408 [Methylophilus rhizosphaerae]|uniref:DUF4194 domain-containing protein n=1 Tax=Methylophilus rhizosphaerae TaxID=492660 RepID=A0A1G8ZPI8_9PROT|nr:hypothetical protein [Methylophilus rhizosphaerae]SDK16275.1 hypothetical protein SAMN05192566_0408 [Methylophilus rhizosphaerae]
MEFNSRQFTARLIASRFLSREDDMVRRLLVDLSFRQEVETSLAACGLRLLDHPFAAHVAVALQRETEGSVFDDGEQWQASNLNLRGLSKDAMALLVVLWALIILPKRERQLGRERQEEQSDLFGSFIKAVGEDVSRGIAENVLMTDFGKLLGGKGRISINLGILSRLDLIERRNKVICEGPLLDLVFDYAEMAPRIIHGAMGDLIRTQLGAPPVQDEADEEQETGDVSDV